MSKVALWFKRPSAQPLRVLCVVLVLAFCVEFLIMLGLPLISDGKDHPGADAVIDSLTLTLILTPALWFIIVRPLQRLSISRGRLLAQLFSAQEEERGRLARDLHDELGQHLTAVLVGLRNVELAGSLEQARERAGAVAEAGTAGLANVRRIARGLRPVVLEDLGLAPAVERLCEEFRASHGIGVTLDIGLEPGARFSAEAEMCVFRVLQESMTNCARHSGAKTVRVGLEAPGSVIRLSVADDGRGFDTSRLAGTSFGLTGIRERVEALDGSCVVHSTPGVGTTIRVNVPIAKPSV